jgi:hypothetical protein
MAQTQRKLRIGIFTDAVVFPFANILSLLKLGLIPLIIVMLINYAMSANIDIRADLRMTSPEDMAAFMRAQLPAQVVGSILLLVVGVIYAVGVHRIILRHEYPGWVILRFRRYELAYLGAVVLYVLITTGVQLFALLALYALGFPDFAAQFADLAERAGGLLFLAFGALMVFTAWLGLRLLLMMPHAAVTGEISPAVSWRATRGNFWRLFAASLLLVLVLLPIMAVASLLVQGALGGVAVPMGRNIAMLPISGFIYSMTFALASYAYKELVLDEAPPSLPQHAAPAAFCS